MVCLVVVALLLCFACAGCDWVVGCVVGGGFLSLRMIAIKRKGKPLGLVLSSGVVVLFVVLCLLLVASVIQLPG